jgi:hypothetical protein
VKKTGPQPTPTLFEGICLEYLRVTEWRWRKREKEDVEQRRAFFWIWIIYKYEVRVYGVFWVSHCKHSAKMSSKGPFKRYKINPFCSSHSLVPISLSDNLTVNQSLNHYLYSLFVPWYGRFGRTVNLWHFRIRRPIRLPHRYCSFWLVNESWKW